MNSLFIVLVLAGKVALVIHKVMDSAVCYFAFCLVNCLSHSAHHTKVSKTQCCFKQIVMTKKLLFLAYERCTVHK